MKRPIAKDTLISICMVTYNHEKWISQAIEGVLMQKSQFSIELIIGEDCSTDNTREIIRSYLNRNPGIIKAYFNQENLGLANNFSQLLNKCNGDYIAICEGDDFWTDPFKLQKQVEVLENNYDIIMCTHNCSKFYESDKILNQKFKYCHNFQYDQKRFIEEWVTQPLTCVFRNIFRDYTLIKKEEDLFCDVILFYELLKHGNGYFMHDNMATFRVHQNALSSGLSRWQWLLNHVIMFDYLYKYNKRDILLQKVSQRYCLSLYIYNLRKKCNEKHDFYPLKEYFKRTPGNFEKIYTIIVKVPFYILRHGIFSRVISIFPYDQ